MTVRRRLTVGAVEMCRLLDKCFPDLPRVIFLGAFTIEYTSDIQQVQLRERKRWQIAVRIG